ncbi:MAG TPA: cellulase family glycosylhydrolase [Armatimonadota bacterium]|nr:cellulase family glycosylhydrolase [Armatimonadota bacterium]
MFRLSLVLFALSLAVAAHAAPPMLHVVGNKLLTTRGQVVRLQGVNIPSLEWSSRGESVLKSVAEAATEWHANVIRLPVAQDRWFGHTKNQTDGGEAYRQLVDSVIQAAAAHNSYVILDLHWSDMGDWGQAIGQHAMPDLNSVLFWQDAAKRYANNPAVLFDLYNEPRVVSWDVWKNGGVVTEKDRKGGMKTYQSPGMQKLVSVVRATGAKNVIVAGGLDWAYDLSGIAKGYALNDPEGNGIMYATHIYPWKGAHPANWDPHVTIIADRYPILVGEVGCRPDPKQPDPNVWGPEILAWIDQHHYNWTAWSFHPGASPCLISDWNYTPTPYWGAYVKAALAPKKTGAR